MRFTCELPQPDHFCTALAVNLAADESIALANILQGSNWTVKSAQTCREAIDLSRQAPARVVLCQPRMPDGTWNTLMEELSPLPIPPAVVVVSRFADDHLWVEVLNLGGYDVLMTPFHRSEVFRVLFLASTASRRVPEGKPAALKKMPGVEKVAQPPMALRLERALTDCPQ